MNSFPKPEEYQTDDDLKTAVVRSFKNGWWLGDSIHKETKDTAVVHEFDHPGFEDQEGHPFDYPEARILNEMIRDGLLAVDISPHPNNDYFNIRRFRLVETPESVTSVNTSPSR
jgi:hypothetical protein